MNFDVKVTDADGNECTQDVSLVIAGAAGVDWTQLLWVTNDYSDGLATAVSTPNGITSDTCQQDAAVPNGTDNAFAQTAATMTYNGPAANCKMTIACPISTGTGNLSNVFILFDSVLIIQSAVYDPPASRIVTFTVPDSGGVAKLIEVYCYASCPSGPGFPWQLSMNSKFENV